MRSVGRFFVRSLACVLLLGWHAAQAQPQSLDLSGEWRFELDRGDVGIQQDWSRRSLAGHIQLPGCLQTQGYGDEISTNTPWVLSLYDRYWYLRADYRSYAEAGHVKVPFVCQPPRHYLGAAWYQRDIEVPAAWHGQRVTLSLDRPHWETTVWLDGARIGSCNSLVAPHCYELGSVSPGRHTLTIRVDNRMILPYRPDAHSVSDSLGGSWNGLAGSLTLTATTPVWIADAQVFPDIEKKTVRIKTRIGNKTGKTGSGTLSAGGVSVPVTWNTNGGLAELVVALGSEAQLWDEFHPVLQRLTLRLKGDLADDQRELSFGLRDFRAAGQEFVLNGRKTYLRGTHHGGDFPLTGFPPTDVEYWRKLFGICRDWGLNHVRFHSFCPPDAAFTAADELGLYLQPECGMWNELSPGTRLEQMMYQETERMIQAYGNHPSFVLLSPSNEPKGRWKEALPKWVEHFRQADPRRLYTTGTGWSLIDRPGPVQGADYLAIGRVGENRVRGSSGWFGRDYADSVRGVNVPVVSHEVGQWCAYPGFDLISKFTGYMRPGNYEIFRDSLAAHGLLEKNKDFAWASGRFQLQCYKEEIEANLRTPGLAGFQLLDLHDYVGQGTALVGVLDPFWESKGYATPEEFRRFCNTTVPLAHLKTRVFTTADPFDAQVEVAHYGAAPLTNASAAWKIVDGSNVIVASGEWPPCSLPVGKNFALGKVHADLSRLSAPRACTLVVTVRPAQNAAQPFENDWAFWVYPAQTNLASPQDLLVTRSWAEAETRLSAGGKVLFLPRAADLDWTCPPLDNVPIFWNRLMNPGWSRMLGLWCDAKHPALAGFPTDANCDWQWTDLIRRTRAVNLDRLPRTLQAIVQPIDDWNRNYRLGLVFECKVGSGRLVVSSVDLASAIESRPVARQLRRSLLDYMAGSRFKPAVEVPLDQLRGLWFDTRLMRKLDARADGDGSNAAAALDGDPNTSWISGGGRRGDGLKHPHQLTITFPKPVPMAGLVLMNRQNDRDHLGDIRGYAVQASDDGQQWREVARGELASTWQPQTVHFAAPLTTKQLKFTSLSGFGPDTSAALAELAVLYAGEPLPDNDAADADYSRARSTSTDVDEGGPRAAPRQKAPQPR